MVLGFIFGLVLSVALAFAITMLCVKDSNDLGDSKGTYIQFTGEKMNFISKSK